MTVDSDKDWCGEGILVCIQKLKYLTMEETH